MEDEMNYRKSYSFDQNKPMPICQMPPPKPRRTFATEARSKHILDSAIDREVLVQKETKKGCKISRNQNCCLQTLV